MKMNTIESLLAGNAYPGRGILIGTMKGCSVIAYFLMGRSENSRNRVLYEEGDALKIRISDEAKLEDPSLILYAPMRVCAGSTVVTNGDHTDTICASLLSGHSLQFAMSTRCYEPDAPNDTPRICGLALPTGRYTLGIVKKAENAPDCVRKYWSYDAREGVAHLIHTYESDGDPLPAFRGEPRELEIAGTPEALADQIWGALNEANRIALCVRSTDLRNGRFASVIRNKLSGD